MRTTGLVVPDHLLEGAAAADARVCRARPEPDPPDRAVPGTPQEPRGHVRD